MSANPPRFFWKGKRVSERVYKHRCRQKNVGKTIMKRFIDKSGAHNLETCLKADETVEFMEVEGRRIIHVDTLAKQLCCRNCKSTLSLTNILSEKLIGVASKFVIQCQQCKTETGVCTDKQHKVKNQNAHFDGNTKGVIGEYTIICIYNDKS